MSATATRPATGARDEEFEVTTAPLSLSMVRRIWAYTGPYGQVKHWLTFLVFLRAAQLAGLATLLGWVIDDTIAHLDPVRLAWGTGAYLALAMFTNFCFRYRLLLSLTLQTRRGWLRRRRLPP